MIQKINLKELLTDGAGVTENW